MVWYSSLPSAGQGMTTGQGGVIDEFDEGLGAVSDRWFSRAQGGVFGERTTAAVRFAFFSWLGVVFRVVAFFSSFAEEVKAGGAEAPQSIPALLIMRILISSFRHHQSLSLSRHVTSYLSPQSDAGASLIPSHPFFFLVFWRRSKESKLRHVNAEYRRGRP